MFRTPISTTDLYAGSTILSLVLICGTLISNAHPIVTLLALVAPSFIITIRLVLLSEDYSEQNLVTLQADVYLSIIALTVLSIASIGIITYSTISTLWTFCIFGSSLLPLRILHTTIGTQYETVEFGFRSSLPNSEFWESATVCIQNGRDATSPVRKSLWYWLATQRFKTLTNRTSPDNLYENHHIANGYYAITKSLTETFSPFTTTQHTNISEVELDSILVDFTQQECYRCGTHHPVSKMYILTDEGTVTEMYCEDCVEQQQPSASATSRSDFNKSARTETTDTGDTDQQKGKTEQQQTQSERRHTTTENTDFQSALNTFNLTKDEFETFSEADLKQTYRELVQENHPDAGGDAEKFKQIVDAYQQLQDELN